MGYSLGFASQATEDLDRIIAYIASDNPAASIRFKKALLNKVELLRVAPEIGVSVKRRLNIHCASFLSHLLLH